MPYANSTKQREYIKLRNRLIRGSKLAIAGKTILEQTNENMKQKEVDG
jgi:hypothetical protein